MISSRFGGSTKYNGTNFEGSMQNFEKMHSEEVEKGMKINVKSVNILFIACKLININKELSDIMKVTSTTQKEIAKWYNN